MAAAIGDTTAQSIFDKNGRSQEHGLVRLKVMKRSSCLLSVLVLCTNLFANNVDADSAYEDYKIRFRNIYDWTNDPGVNQDYGDYPLLLSHYYHGMNVLDSNFNSASDGLINLRDTLARANSKFDWIVANINKSSSIQNMERKLGAIKRVKEFNPNVKIFLYWCLGTHVPSSWFIIENYFGNTLRDSGWYIYDINDSIFPGAQEPDPGGGGIPNYRNPACASWVAGYFDTLMTAYPYFDGIWSDLTRGYWIFNSWLNTNGWNVDMNDNGINDVTDWGLEATIDSLQRNYDILVDSLRNRLGSTLVYIGNPGQPWGLSGSANDSILYSSWNGNMQEGAQNNIVAIEHGAICAVRNSSHAFEIPQRFFVIEVPFMDTVCCCSGRGDSTIVRYGLALSCLADAFFCYDATDTISNYELVCPDCPQRQHSNTWWFNEYNVNLGKPIGSVQILYADGKQYLRRDFENGIVLADSSSVNSVTIDLEAPYYDPSTRDTVEVVALNSKDGRLLIKQEEEISGNESLHRPPYPNPFTGYTIMFGRETEDFSVFDVIGKQVGTYQGSRIGEGLSAGVYFVMEKALADEAVHIVKVR